MLTKAIDEISANIKLDKTSVVIFNPLSFERSDVTTFRIPSEIKNPVLVDRRWEKDSMPKN